MFQKLKSLSISTFKKIFKILGGYINYETEKLDFYSNLTNRNSFC